MKIAMFMRGINVGGIKVPMAELQACLTELGLTHIKTFLQTGNVVFDSSSPQAKLKPLIETALSERFSYTAHVLLYSASDLRQIVEKCPFEPTDRHRYVIFCDTQSTVDGLAAHASDLDSSLEEVVAGKNVLYWNVDKGRTLDAGFSKILAKSKYKQITTNRNIRTIEKMVAYIEG